MAIQYLNGINVSGDVGIGTDTPYKTLDVQGEAVISQNLWIGPVGGNDAANSLEIGRGRTGNGICFIDMTTDNTTYTDYGFRLIRFSGVNSNTELIHRGTGDFRIKGQEASNMRFYTGNSERMSITSSGDVGIGTTSPQYQLHSYNEIGTQTLKLGYGVGYAKITTDDASKPLEFQIGGTTRMSINQNSNVGIGTTSPSEKLHVSGGNLEIENNFPSLIINSDNASGAYNQILSQKQGNASPPQGSLWWKDGSYGGGSRWTTRITSPPYTSSYINLPHNSSGGNFAINIENNERLTINRSNGNVGIGVTIPNYPLDVNGTVDATNFRAGGISKYTIYNSTNTYENYGTTISNIASSPVGYLYHDLLAFNYNYTVTQEVSTDGTNFSSETLDKRLFSQKQDQSITVVSSSEYAVRWTVEGTAYNNAKFINLAFTYTNPHPATRVIIESSADGTTWISRHDSTASGITGTKSCYVGDWGANNYVRITISKTSSNTNLINLSSIKMMTARAGNQGDGMELQYPYVWDEDRNIGLLLTKSDTPTSKLDVLGATNTSNSSLLRVRTTRNPNAPEKVVGFYINTNTERGYIAINQYAVTYSTSSDYRLKENVVPISNGIERIKALNPCRFNFIGASADNIVDGFIAHEAAEVVPESVVGEKDAVDENNEPTYQGIDQSKIVPLLTAALKEAIEKIEQLENRIQTLENN